MGKLEVFTVIFVALFFVGMTQALATEQRWEESTYYDIYKATLPFGVFLLDGEISGGIFLFSGSISGSIATEEHYLVKYFQEGELRSTNLKASEVPIVVDGTLRLEKIESYLSQTMYFWTNIYDKGTMWKIHIPYLPEVNQTLTEDWTK